jgi:hypothetical protein
MKRLFLAIFIAFSLSLSVNPVPIRAAQGWETAKEKFEKALL